MSTFKTFVRLNIDNYDLDDNVQRVINQLQNNTANSFGPLISKPQNDNSIISNVTLLPGVINTINHGLGSTLQTWGTARKRGPANIWDVQDQNKSPNLTLLLMTDIEVVVDLIVS